jgi:hypothetical protein
MRSAKRMHRTAVDRIFNQHNEVIPIYFAFTRNETTAVSAAIEFLNTFLQQYIAFRRWARSWFPGVAALPS